MIMIKKVQGDYYKCTLVAPRCHLISLCGYLKVVHLLYFYHLVGPAPVHYGAVHDEILFCSVGKLLFFHL